MGFEEDVFQLISNVDCFEHNEATTKKFLIEPFLKMLGYDSNNHLDVIPEYTCDVGTKKGEKLDYMIIQNQVPIILVECKNVDVTLTSKHYSQLYRYFSVTQTNTRKLGVLTNGLIYQFYSDLESSNVIDGKPFLEMNLRNLNETDIYFIEYIKKENLDIDYLIEEAERLKYRKQIKELLFDEMNNPSKEFIKYFASQVYKKKITQQAYEYFEDITISAIQEYLDEIIESNQIESNQEDSLFEDIFEENAEESNSDLEKEAFYIVKSILKTKFEDIVEIERRTNKTYCAILFNYNNRKTLCRLYFNKRKKYIGLFDKEKTELKVEIDSLDNIYHYQDELCNTYEFYKN